MDRACSFAPAAAVQRYGEVVAVMGDAETASGVDDDCAGLSADAPNLAQGHFRRDAGRTGCERLHDMGGKHGAQEAFAIARKGDAAQPNVDRTSTRLNSRQ